MFETYDKISESNAQLNDSKFEMGMIDKKKSFETFYARFSAIITPLKFSDVIKISNLTRLISNRLKHKLTKQTFTTYRDLIDYLRKLNLNLKQINNTVVGNKEKETIKQTRFDIFNREMSFTEKDSEDNKLRDYKYSKSLMDRIRKEGRCFKCLQTDHRSEKDNALCKNAPPLNKEQVEVILKIADVEDTSELSTTDAEN